MGSKSSNAQAPDPRLVDAQIKSMGYQDEAIKRITANSDEMLPLQKESMRFGLDTSRAAYDQSQEDRSWMLGRRGALTGLQDTLISDAASYNAGDEGERMAGLAVGDVNQGFSSARDQFARGMTRMGVNPNDGKFAAASRQSTNDQALAIASAKTKTRQAAKEIGWSLTDRASNALSGYPAMAAGVTGAGAGYGASGLGLTNTGLAGMNSGYGAAGTLAGGMGSNAPNMWGTQASYKNGQDQIAAQSDPASNILGAAAGVTTRAALNKWGP
jgi:hypothetical protein